MGGVVFPAQLALLVAFLCVRLARGWPSWAAFQYFEVVALWFFVVLLVFLLMHLFRLQARMPCINWPLTVSSRTRTGTLSVRTRQEASSSLSGVLPLLCGHRPPLHWLRCGHGEEFWRLGAGGWIGTVLILCVLERLLAFAECLLSLQVFGFLATFLMAVNLWTSYSVSCGPHQTGTCHWAGAGRGA